MLGKNLSSIVGLPMLLASILHCSGHDQSKAELDVSSDTAKIGTNLSASGNSTQIDPKLPPTGSAVIKWQQFFQPKPGIEEKRAIESQLRASSESSDAKSLLNRGRKEMAIGLIKQAEASLRSALRKEETNREILLELSQLFLIQRRSQEAYDSLGALRKILGSEEREDREFILRYRYVLAQLYLLDGDRSKAHSILTDLVRLNPDFAPAYAVLASSYLASNKVDAARFILKSGIDRGGPSPDLLNLLGVVEQRSGRIEDARQHFRKVLSINPTHVGALVNLASLMIEEFEFDAAANQLGKAISLDPGSGEAHLMLGIIAKRQGKLKEAREEMTRALNIDPQNAFARYNLAILMSEGYSQHEEAIRLFHEVLQTEGSSKELRNLSQTYIEELENSRKAE